MSTADEMRENFYRLHDQLDQQLQSFERSAQSLEPTTSRDEKQVIEVRVRQDGTLDRLLIHEGWIDEYEPTSLGAAVVATYVAAGHERARAWSEALTQEEESRTSRARSMPRPSETIAGQVEELMEGRDLSAHDPSTVLDSVAEMLREMNAGLDQAIAQLDEQAATSVTRRSSGQLVEATAGAQGELLRVEYDDAIEDKSAVAITRETVEAIDAAQAAARTAVPADPLAGTALQDIMRIAQDPAALAERVRLFG